METIYISFVLPAYNEEESVLPLMEQITGAMQNIPHPYEIVFIIEGNDKTLEYLKNYKINNPQVNLRMLYQEKPLGLMRAFKKGFVNISDKATHVVTMDVDLNHDPSELIRFIPKAQEGYNIIIGSRAVKGAKIKEVPAWKKVVSKIANTIFNKVFKIAVKDKTSGYRMIDVDTIKEVAPQVRSRNFEGLMEFLLIANKKGKKMVEVPITLTYRQFGETKFTLFKTGRDYGKLLITNLRLRK